MLFSWNVVLFSVWLHRSHQGIWCFCGQQLPTTGEAVETLY